MRIHKWFIPFGLIAVFSFLALTVLGRMLWPGYDPVTSYISVLITDEAPHVYLMRSFMNIYTVCFLLFSFSMAKFAFFKYNIYARIGYLGMLATAMISAIGYGGYPISMALVFSRNDIVHILVTLIILCTTALSVLFIAIGYLKHEETRKMGRVSLTAFIMFVAFNLWHLHSIFSGSQILGLIERFTTYTLLALIFVISLSCLFGQGELFNVNNQKPIKYVV